MIAYAFILTGLCCFCLGALTLALVAWFGYSDTDDAEFERRRAEQQLQRLTHTAMVQMLAEARRGRFGQQPADE